MNHGLLNQPLIDWWSSVFFLSSKNQKSFVQVILYFSRCVFGDLFLGMGLLGQRAMRLYFCLFLAPARFTSKGIVCRSAVRKIFKKILQMHKFDIPDRWKISVCFTVTSYWLNLHTVPTVVYCLQHSLEESTLVLAFRASMGLFFGFF